MTNIELLHSIKVGDRVTILVHAGIGRNGPEQKPRAGRAVMFNAQYDSWVLDMGGAYGTPGIASAENLVSVRRRK